MGLPMKSLITGNNQGRRLGAFSKDLLSLDRGRCRQAGDYTKALGIVNELFCWVGWVDGLVLWRWGLVKWVFCLFLGEVVMAVARVERLDDKGRGVARVEGKVVFIEGALPEEDVRFSVVEEKRRFARAQLTEVMAPSALRVMPPCPLYARCGGCDLQHLQVSGQRAYKQSQWLAQLARLGGVVPERVGEPLLGEAWGYRYRARLAVVDGVMGFRARGGHDVVAVLDCLVLTQALRGVLPEVALVVVQIGGCVEVELHAGDEGVAVGLRLAQGVDVLAVARRVEAMAIEGVGWWLAVGRGDFYPLAGVLDKKVAETAFLLRYGLLQKALEIEFSPNDFTQVNREVNRLMVEKVIELLALEAGDEVVDFFCGLGNFSLPLAYLGAQVVAVEGVESMTRKLKRQAQMLGLSERVRVECVDLFKPKREAIRRWGRVDKWLLDPPRAGAKALIEAMGRERPSRVVYVSCNPATLARDAGLLVARGYVLQEALMMDMFVQTAHIECVAVFELGG